ncbi:TadE/TadG family type IV pilus assembly protein [Novosphingobium mangrovi (ex Huang et al. 2023)]|uniref:Pilus assembly protein n=1 Tax=Novosphingobium mangrovi (ex Huang et al. 2023) TaxID=2976432 RepID=A0ABT2I687_9SPHN|nr:TadE/TadG family type IV pilus assembly protein [Novosphingobium mangrovi (ex Huang et al. 2023)]MCT2400062.1 pilus assembly protein [Novosphingobium mangrovi (ex Huang et al. 2023)]
MSSLSLRFGRDRRGTASAEMVLMLPLLVVMLFAMFEGGHFLYSQHVVTKAVRDGARFAGRAPFSNFTNCTRYDSGGAVIGGTGAVDPTLEGQVRELTRTGQLSGGTARLNGWVASDVTVTCAFNSAFTKGVYRTQANGAATVTVSASVAYTSLFGVLGGLSGNLNLNASAQAAVMGI